MFLPFLRWHPAWTASGARTRDESPTAEASGQGEAGTHRRSAADEPTRPGDQRALVQHHHHRTEPLRAASNCTTGSGPQSPRTFAYLQRLHDKCCVDGADHQRALTSAAKRAWNKGPRIGLAGAGLKLELPLRGGRAVPTMRRSARHPRGPAGSVDHAFDAVGNTVKDPALKDDARTSHGRSARLSRRPSRSQRRPSAPASRPRTRPPRAVLDRQ